MIILRLTQALLKDMKTTSLAIDNGPNLLSWHVNIYHLNNRKHLVFVNDLTRLSIIIDGIRTGQITQLKERFLKILAEYLLIEGIKEDVVKSYIQIGSEIVISKTNSRSVLGTMKEVTFFSEDEFIDNIDRMRWLNRLIHKPIDYHKPISVFKEAINNPNNFKSNE